MLKVQVLEDEALQEYADFDNAEVWLLSIARPDAKIDPRVIVEQDLAEEILPASHKFPQLMTRITARHPVKDGQMQFEYEVLAHDKSHFEITICTCGAQYIKVIGG